MLTTLDLTLDCANAAAPAEFWTRAVGYVDAPQPVPFGVAWLVDPRGGTPSLCGGFRITCIGQQQVAQLPSRLRASHRDC